MNLTFRLRFVTNPGQSLWLLGSHPLPDHPIPLRYLNKESWEVSVPLARIVTETPFSYSYILRNQDGSQTTDWGRDRTLKPAGFKVTDLVVIDSWNQPGFVENAFYTEPFKQVLLADNFTPIPPVTVPSATHTFRVKSPLLKKNETICLLGDGPKFGAWNTQSPILLSRKRGEDYFTTQMDLRGQAFPVACKYGVFDVDKNVFVRFEGGDNRHLNEPPGRDKHTLINDGFATLPAADWHGAGVAIPVFSLRSENGFGTGEFVDLKPLADWARQTGLKLIQLLPVNDTSATGTRQDSYPYAAISAFALHPLYLNLDAVVEPKNRRHLKALAKERERLNRAKTLEYEAVMQGKLALLRKIFPSQKAATFRSREYKKFFTENKDWLVPYAIFCHLRDKFHTADFNQWPEHRRFDAHKTAALAKLAEVQFYCFIQFQLHVQLQDAAAYAHAAGIVLKGDIAIGVFRNSVDAWQHPELFHMDQQAGAPPDAFADKGQNWGFPTYNWPRMATDGFAWWKHRFSQMRNYFDAFRIDHILGFFRIWSSPADAVEGILGHFVPAIPVTEQEFEARGIPFDRDRLAKPFINDAVIGEIFGPEADLARREFLVFTGEGQYVPKPAFATQRLVADHFAKLPDHARNKKLKIGLFDLISNVILLESDGQYHFRFDIEKTLSFQNFSPDIQTRLRDLYIDYFFRRQDNFWMGQAMQKLPALKRVTNMLICGEDLGLVPACVPEVMRDLGFLSLEIQRMPKSPAQTFSRPANAPYLSVVTPSTHDMSTIRGWWAEDRALTQRFYNEELGLAGEAPQTCEPEIAEAIIRQHLTSPAMWSIFQLQDLFALDGKVRRADVAAERINIPGIPNYYWRYRMHLTLEKLQEMGNFNARLTGLLRETGRTGET